MTDSSPRFDRRHLLKATLLTGATAAVARGQERPGAAPNPAPAPDAPTTTRLNFRDASATQAVERTVQTACQFCNALCGLSVGVRDDRVVSIDALRPDPVQDGKLCLKADLMAELVANGRRLTTPLRRVSGAKGSPESAFEPVSWDEALETIARRWLALRDAGEAHTIANRTTGRMLRGAGELIGRILHRLGSPNAHDVGPVCNDAGGDALRLTFGLGNFTNGYGVDPATGHEDLGSATYVLMLGTNQAETHPVTFDYVLRHRARRRARLVVADPRRTPTAAHADLHLPLRPGTDLALALGLLGHVLAHDLWDAEFVAAHVLGFDALRAHVQERGYGPEWAAERCGVPAAQIAQEAERYAQAEAAAIYCNAGVSHQVNAFATYRALAFLAAITGNIGRPGAGCNFMHNTWPGGLSLPPLEDLPDLGPALPAGPDHFADAILDGAPYPLRAVMTQGNPLLSSADSTRVREAYAQLDFYVYTGLFLEEAAYYADVILPVASGLEFDGVYMRRDDRGIRWQRQAVPRVGDARTDVEIFEGLARALGRLDRRLGAEEWERVVEPGWRDYGVLWDTFAAHTPGVGGLTRARLEASTVPLRWPCPTPEHPGVSTLYLDHPSWYAAAEALGARPGRRFLTPSGKVELTTPALEAALGAAGHAALPEYFTHPETTGQHVRLRVSGRQVRNPLKPFSLTPVASFGPREASTAGEAFPLVGTIGRSSVVHFAGVTHWTPTGKRLDGVRAIQVHPTTLRRFGVSDGAEVWVESPRGRVRGVAQAFAGIREDTVFVPNGFGPAQAVGPEVGAPVYETAANTLVDANHFDTLSGQQAYKCFACRILPVE